MKFGSILKIFKRNRHPGDIVFATSFVVFSFFLLSQIETQIKWVKNVQLYAQPGFWSAVGLIGMSVFASLYFVGSVLSYREHRNFQEVIVWIKSVEYALWFLAYVWLVPIVGYLPSTLIFVGLLTLRTGYRETWVYIMAGAVSIAIVVVFKSFLAVKFPGGALYDYLPESIRSFMHLYL